MATMKNCRTCGGAVSSSAKVCPHCGERNPGSMSTKKTIIIYVITVISITLLLYGCVAITGPYNPNLNNGTSQSKKCYWCGGSGWVSNGSTPKDALDFALNHKTCPKCNGTGVLP